MIKKDITFIYMDAAEKSIMEPIAEEAKKRGYSVGLTQDKFAKCEIGVYCQHVNFPEYSKFSVIMLHDIIQQYGYWPDIWFREPWNKYDIGILPSNQWEENWNKSSQWFYANPRKGVYKVGWPKADRIKDIDAKEYRRKFNSEHGLSNDKMTVLYAPSWENDHKQDDFVQAALKLDVNILIKQCSVSPEQFPAEYAAIKEMYELHRDNPRVTILNPETNIFDAIFASDILVSEESSTMAEALMAGIPAISVSNWLIPDVVPSRFPSCDYDFVIKTLKENLTDCMKDIIENYEKYLADTEKFREKNFCHIGKSSEMIMDIIDDYVDGKTVRYESLKPAKREHCSLSRYILYKEIALYRKFAVKYVQRYKLVKHFWKFIKRCKRAICKEPNVRI